MENVMIDENGDYGLEYSNAIWASDKMHKDYYNAKVELSDADFLLENERSIMIIEYKNANTMRAREVSFKTPPFNPILFALQKNMNTGITLIDKVEVLSIDEWNMHDEYGKYPFIKIQEKTKHSFDKNIKI